MRVLEVVLMLTGVITLTCATSVLDEIKSRVKRGTSPSDCQQADMIFVLDSSGSIGRANWQKVLDFVIAVVQDFTIGENNVRIGVTTYGNRATINFHLNEYYDTVELVDAINRINWKDQMTNTSGGIWTMYDLMFVEQNGDRPDIPNIGLVITDGVSNRDPELTIPSANEARRKGIMMIALGIGDQVQQDELQGIANEVPNPVDRTHYVYNADNFDALDTIREQLVAAACEQQSSCEKNGDILFILDASASIGHRNFEAIKITVQDLVNATNVVDDGASIGVISYNSAPTLNFNLGEFQSRSDVNDAITKITFTSGIGGTDTAAALRMARVNIYQTNINRPNEHDTIILFTDGGSDDYEKTIDEAKQLRMMGVGIMVVGIGKWLNELELRSIATDPDVSNVLLAETVADLELIRGEVKAAICRDNKFCGEFTCFNGGTCIEGLNHDRCVCPDGFAGVACEIKCTKKADVVLVLDESTSIGKENFYLMQEFAKDLVRTLNVRDNEEHTRFGLETFGNSPAMKFNLNQYKDNDDAANAISFKWNMGQTNTADALNMLRTNMFTPGNGDRSNIRNVGILLTDGRSNDRRKTFDEAVQLHNAGVNVLAIGVGVTHYYDKMELEGIATDPNARNIYYTGNFSTLQDIVQNVVVDICDEENSCESFPCQGETQCVDKLGGYQCMCRESRTGINCERRCSGKADIIFMVDTSGSIRRHRFRIFKDYVKSVISEMDIRSERTRIGLLTFNEDINIQFNLSTYNTKEDILQATERLEWVAGRTNIADALRMARTFMFTTQNGDRDDTPNFGILLTDGQATVNAENTLPEAIEARVAGIHLIVVAAERKVTSLELKGIATDPDGANLFAVNRFSQLPTLRNNLINAMCDDTDECSSSPCQNAGRCVDGLNQFICLCTSSFTGVNCERRCTARVDVAFILDASGSVEQKFDMQLELAKLIVQGLNFDIGRTRVAVTTFSRNAQIRFTFNAFNDKQSVLNSIAFELSRGRTNTADALRITREDVFSNVNGDRTDPNFVIIMTDGHSNINPQNTLPQATRLKNERGARIIAVGIGETFQLNPAELNGMASDPDSDYSFQLANDSEMESVANRILDTICQ